MLVYSTTQNVEESSLVVFSQANNLTSTNAFAVAWEKIDEILKDKVMHAMYENGKIIIKNTMARVYN